MTIPTLETTHLHFRAFRQSDFEDFVAHHNDPVTTQVYGEMSRGDVWRRMAIGLGHWQLRGFGPFLLEEKATGKFAGTCGIGFPEGWQDLEIGYGIAPGCRRKGYATEAVRRLQEYGYKERGFAKLVSYISPSNVGSQAVARSVGAMEDGEFDMPGHGPHIIFVHPKPNSTFN